MNIFLVCKLIIAGAIVLGLINILLKETEVD